MKPALLIRSSLDGHTGPSVVMPSMLDCIAYMHWILQLGQKKKTKLLTSGFFFKFHLCTRGGSKYLDSGLWTRGGGLVTRLEMPSSMLLAIQTELGSYTH